MAKRGLLYRCHLFSYGGPQTEGVESRWTQGLAPVGDRRLLTGDLVELAVTITDSDIPISADSAIRFDILEEDFFLSGLKDDRIGSILCGPAEPAVDEDFALAGYREPIAWTLPLRQTPAEAVAEFVEDHPEEFDNYLLILRDPVAHETYNLVTWWRITPDEDTAGGSEFYFLVNIDNAYDDQSQPVLNVASERAPRPPWERLDAAMLDRSPLERLTGATVSLPFALASDAVDMEGPGEGEEAIAAEMARIWRESRKGGAAVPLQPQPQSTPAAEYRPPAPPSASQPLSPTALIPASAPAESGTEPLLTVWPYMHPEAFAGSDNAVDRDLPIKSGKSPFDGKVLLRLEPDLDVAIRSPAGRFVESYAYERAVNWGRLMFGLGGYAIIEGPLFDKDETPGANRGPRYYVLPLETKVELGRLEQGQARTEGIDPQTGKIVATTRVMLLPSFPSRPYLFDSALNGYAVYRVFSVESRGAVGPGEDLFTRWERNFLLEADIQGRRVTSVIDPRDPVAADFSRLGFSDIDKALEANDADAAIRLLAAMSRDSFAVIPREQRRKYFVFLVDRLPTPFDGDILRAMVEILSAVMAEATKERFDELAELRKLLDKPELVAKADWFIRSAGGAVWDLLELIGKQRRKLPAADAAALPPASPPFTIDAEFILRLFLEAMGLSTPAQVLALLARLDWSVKGLAMGAKVFAEAAQALDSLFRTLWDLIAGVVHLLLHITDLFKAIAALLELITKAIFAALPLPKELTIEAMVDAWLPFLNHGSTDPLLRDMALSIIRENAPDLDARLKALPPEVRTEYGYVVQFHAQTRTELKALGQHIEDVIVDTQVGAETFGVTEQVVRAIKWRAVWEIASLFVGVGELKAVASGARALVVGTVNLASRLGRGANELREAEKLMALARLLARESKAADAAAYARAMARLPEAELKDAAKAADTLQHVDDVQTLDQLAAHNPSVPPAVNDVAAKAEASVLMERKLGGTVTDAARETFDDLAHVLTPQQMRELFHALPDSEAAKFMEALAKARKAGVGGLADFSPDALAGIARAPRSLAMVGRGEIETANRLVQRGAGGVIDWEKTERYVAAYEEEAARLGRAGDQAALKAFVEDVDSGQPDRLGRLRQLADDVPQPVVPRPRGPPREPLPPVTSRGHEIVRDMFPATEDIFPRSSLPEGVTGPFNGSYDPFVGLTQAQRDALNLYAQKYPGKLRRLVTELNAGVADARRASDVARVGKLQGFQGKAQDLDAALKSLNKAFVQCVEKSIATSGIDATRIAAEITEQGLQKAVTQRLKEFSQRAKEFRQTAVELEAEAAKATDVAAAEKLKAQATAAKGQAQDLDRQADGLVMWASDEAARSKDVADLRQAIDGSVLLKDRLRNGGGSMLQRLVCDMLFNPNAAKDKAAKTILGDLEKYVSTRMREFRGYAGEMDLAFRLGPDFLVLKAPDPFVTRAGTDLLAAQRYLVEENGRVVARYRIFVFDNKSVQAIDVASVTAMVRNLAKNLGDDARAFLKLAEAGEAGAAHTDAIRRLTNASEQIAVVLKRTDAAFDGSLQRLTKASDQLAATVARLRAAKGAQRTLAEHGRALEGLLGSQVDLAATVRELEALAQAGDDSAGLAEAIGQLRAAAQEVGEVLAHPAVEGAAFEQSAQRLQTASEKISAAVGGRKSAKSERAQKAIADVLDELDIQLVVTGEGGQATAVTDRLKRTITFWDPAKSPAPPLRPPRRRLKRK